MQTEPNKEQEIEEAYKRMTADNKKHLIVVVFLAGIFSLLMTFFMYQLFDVMHRLDLELRENAKTTLEKQVGI